MTKIKEVMLAWAHYSSPFTVMTKIEIKTPYFLSIGNKSNFIARVAYVRIDQVLSKEQAHSQ